MAERLSAEARKTALKGLPGCLEVPGREAIARTFTFKDFNEAFGFMARAALVAEKSDHHPEWRNVYKTVEVVLATHDAGGVTARDIDLAKAMNPIAAQLVVAAPPATALATTYRRAQIEHVRRGNRWRGLREPCDGIRTYRGF